MLLVSTLGLNPIISCGVSIIILLLSFMFTPQYAVRFVLENVLKDKVKDKVVVWGGSHGGFLTAHLVGQFPVSLVYAHQVYPTFSSV